MDCCRRRTTRSDEVLVWFVRLLEMFVPSVDHLDQLTAKALFVFGFDPEVTRSRQENAGGSRHRFGAHGAGGTG